MTNICAAADAVRAPAVIRIANEVIVVSQSYPKPPLPSLSQLLPQE